MDETLALLVEAGQHHFAHGRFFAAHEAWEIAWLRCKPGKLREGLRGLVQWTAAAHHASQGRLTDRPGNLLERGITRIRKGIVPLRALGLRRCVLPMDTEALRACVRQPGAFLQFREVKPRLPLTALVLAGGHGRRAGGPKAGKLLDGQRLWQWQCDRLARDVLGPVVAVVHPQVLAEAPDPRGLASDPDAQPFESLQRGLRMLQGRDVLMLPVDCLCPPREVLLLLWAESARDGPWRVVRPRVVVDDVVRFGHPVLLSAAMCAELLADPAETARLDQRIRELPAELRREADVHDERILANFNENGPWSGQ
jgi:molybdopterin-guanine dinucleotide biosynthesis protein A